MKNNFLVLMAIAISSCFTSCTKEDLLEATDNSAVEASASIELANELDIKTGNEISLDNSTSKIATAKSASVLCYTITSDSEYSEFPRTFYVDFGTGCTNANGITRKGKLKITFTDYVDVVGSTMTIERENYYVNNNKIEGKIEYKNTTLNEVPQWTRTVTGGIFTDTEGDVYLNSGSHTVRLTEGAGTITLNDNTYEMIEGTHSVSKQNGGKITLTVQETLVKKFDCDYISKGKLKVENTLFSGVIDYGNGDCDSNGVYKQNGIEFPFSM
ncbi:hypothetical protein [Flavobacterium adhaerens]|uniref:hypothetical protein n=1 Tax=Flavobacterium adhaerens TaxID=3149043 RepID=UPI0032B4DDD3